MIVQDADFAVKTVQWKICVLKMEGLLQETAARCAIPA